MQIILDYAEKNNIRLLIEQDATTKIFVYVDKHNYSDIASKFIKRKIIERYVDFTKVMNNSLDIPESIKWLITDWQTEYTKQVDFIQLGYAKKVKKRLWEKRELKKYKNILYVDMRKEPKDDFTEELEVVNNLSITSELPEHVNIYDNKLIYYKR